jgi:hypothetical protein
MDYLIRVQFLDTDEQYELTATSQSHCNINIIPKVTNLGFDAETHIQTVFEYRFSGLQVEMVSGAVHTLVYEPRCTHQPPAARLRADCTIVG